ncbi:hypothetical protein [Streptomyces sp. NPDC005538]|uniref:hypothetical protein n=1 Tax=unclassified Streptomyces TaxID=2593676 RepID=UPI0033B203C7
MTRGNQQTDGSTFDGFPCHQALLADTDWASLGTARGDGAFLPAVLSRLLDADPVVQANAIKELEPVCHQNSFYGATLPVALYVAAVLDHPATTTFEPDLRRKRERDYPVRAALLDWLGSLAYDADDACVAIGERHFGGGHLDNYPDMRAFRDRRPTFYRAVAPFLGHDDTAVREAAVVAAFPLTEHPEVTRHREGLGRHARHLLATSTNRYNRSRTLDALKTWGHDTNHLETAEDIAARAQHACGGSHVGGCMDDPLF